MAVVETGKLTATAERDQEGNRSYTVTYIVVTDDPNDGPITAGNALGLSVASTFSFGNDSDPGAYFNGASGARPSGADQNGRIIWHIDCQFATRAKQRCDQTQIDNPLNHPPKISGSWIQFQKPMVKNADGSEIKNSAGQPFSDLQMDESRPQLVIQKNYGSINLAQFHDYTDAINNSPFFGLPAKAWKVQAITWEQLYLGSCAPYYSVTFTFSMSTHEGGLWEWEIVDRGWYELDNGNLVQIKTDVDNFPVSEPYPLNGSGAKLPQGDPLQYITVKPYKLRDYNSLGVPTSL